MTAYKSVAQKLLIKADYKVLAVNAPQDYAAKLGELSLNVSLLTQSDAPVNLVHIFVTSRRELEILRQDFKSILKPAGLLWVSYPKGTSGIKVDINRDTIWQYAQTAGFQAVSMIAIDDTWSAMRLKPMK